jgi:xanthine/CO dehydrogenase XdhC/CoxF family maturation factor
MTWLKYPLWKTLMSWFCARCATGAKQGNAHCWPLSFALGARRPALIGSIMALCETGAVVGSVSGGCIEDDLIYRFTQAYATGQSTGETSVIPSGVPQRVKYGITADEAHRFGLPCGGTLELLLEFDPDADGLDALGAITGTRPVDATHHSFDLGCSEFANQ